ATNALVLEAMVGVRAKHLVSCVQGELSSRVALTEQDEGPATADPTATAETNRGATGESATTGTSASTLETGDRLGRYVVLEHLGHGGMGYVVAAYDPQLDRKVALKLLKRTRATKTAQERLRREAQALARLNHTNVITIYEVGTHEDQTFLSMEYVRGKTLREWLRTERPSWQKICERFVEAGRGLAAAHGADLIHRDFKPDNVMLGGDGRVRVMDFGLARRETEDFAPNLDTRRSETESGGTGPGSRLTRTGAHVGTPGYIAPEVGAGVAIDWRVDQFAFCVALFEAVYGHRPYRGSPAAILADLEDSSAQRDKTAAKIPAWLTRALLRGLEPDRDKRYPSMEALLEALERKPGGPRRTALILVLAVTATVGVAVGNVWSSSQSTAPGEAVCGGMDEHLTGIWDDTRRAEVQAALEATKVVYAPETWTRVERGLDAYTSDWVTTRVQACEATHKGEQSGALLDLRVACLDERMRHVKAVVDVLASADAKVVEKANAAVIELPTLARCADADALQAAIAPPTDPAVAIRVSELDERLVQAEVLDTAGKYEEASTIANAVATEAETLGYAPLLVHARLRQGALASTTGDYKGAEALLEQVYEDALGLLMAEEAAQAARKLMFVVGYQLGRPEEGHRWAKDAGPLTKATGTELERGAYLSNLATLISKGGDHEKGRAYQLQALALHEGGMGPQHSVVATTLQNLGIMERQLGNHAQAQAYLERALGITQTNFGPRHPRVVPVLISLGGTSMSQRKIPEARDYFEQALAIQDATLGPDHLAAGNLQANLGVIEAGVGEYARANTRHERALEIVEAAVGPDHPRVGQVLLRQGMTKLGLGRHDEAQAVLERALGIFSEKLGPEHPTTAHALYNLGKVTMSAGELDEARGYFERALSIREAKLGPDHRLVANTLNKLGFVATQAGQLKRARGHHQRALTIHESSPETTPDLIAETLIGSADVSHLQGDLAAAERDYSRAVSLFTPEDSDLVPALRGLAEVLLDRGRPAEAVPLIERALESKFVDDYEGGLPELLAKTRSAL
ncbi:MAG: tetratricopeptide repeat protein, partial [Nannocystaceae bacterium]|nr:tetratricopeptide repeat protein [Nannocystaceae bacterium]